MINLYIGRDQNNCYRIHESILVEASYGFASRIASFRATHPGIPVTLRFPKHDVFAWDVLLL